MKFFVVHTYTGHEAKVKKLLAKLVERSELADQFGRIIVPVERVWRVKKGKKSVEERRLFPGHILVEMEANEDTFKLVNSTPGVVRLLGTKKSPTALSEEEAMAVLEEMDKGQEKMTAEVPFSAGESVKITAGPFAGFIGTVDEINPERGKVRVFVTIFGRSTPIELDIIEVQTI
jgi:transcriptional antiterminator NusG